MVEHDTEIPSEPGEPDATAGASQPPAGRQGLTLFRHEDGGELFESGAMSFPEFPDGITDQLAAEEIELTPMGVGNKTTVLFRGDGPDGVSLAHAWFAPNYLLPRHSHSADCLYYVLRGPIKMGARELTAGEGFFVTADGPYAFQAGPDGAEVLEFRTTTSFDMKILETNLDRWKAIAAIGGANAESWTALRADLDAPA